MPFTRTVAALQCAAVVRACKKPAMAPRLASEGVLELLLCEQKTGLTCAALCHLVRTESCVCLLPAELAGVGLALGSGWL